MHEQREHLSVDGISALGRQRGQASAWIGDEGATTWAEFAKGVEGSRRACSSAGVSKGDVVVIPVRQAVGDLMWLLGAASCGTVVAPLRPARLAELASWGNWFQIHWRIDAGDAVRVSTGADSASAAKLLGQLRADGLPGLILATGGTTGKPKLVLHSLCALTETFPLGTHRPMRVLPLMGFDHIGGLDIALRALAAGHPIVSAPETITAESVASTVERHRVEVMPATPTLLNLLLLAGVQLSHDMGSLKVVPYGAEPMPAALLERLKTAFPAVEFIQRFGTSETGSVPVRRGSSALAMPEDSRGFSWKVVDGELWVRSPSRALGYLGGETGGFAADGWFRTGDVAEELAGGAVRLLGRRQDVINMGGEKILSSEVEGLILSHPLVDDCRVYPVPNPLLGQVVSAEIVWRGADRDPVSIKRAISAHVTDAGSRRKLPTMIRLVDSIAITGNQKKERILSP